MVTLKLKKSPAPPEPGMGQRAPVRGHAAARKQQLPPRRQRQNFKPLKTIQTATQAQTGEDAKQRQRKVKCRIAS